MENQNQPTSEATTATQNNPDLRQVSTLDLANELYRRQTYGVKGDLEPVLSLTVTLDDLVEYWECDDSGATSPAARVPSKDAWRVMRRAFERWQDCGAYSDLMTVLREAWIEADPESFADDQEGGCA